MQSTASKRRREVEFTAELRKLTEEAIAELHRLAASGSVPAAVFKPACEECSLYEICVPQVTGAANGVTRAAHRLFEI
jgi:CRISPR-associated exonuclease Cas4